jgi:hypothetical protein
MKANASKRELDAIKGTCENIATFYGIPNDKQQFLASCINIIYDQACTNTYLDELDRIHKQRIEEQNENS